MTTPIVAVYPGSFDPVTLGHEDVARRTLRFCDRLIVAVADSSSQAKRPLFSVAERLELMAAVFGSEPRIACVSFSGLLVDFAQEAGARFIIRGLRAVSDFEYEFQMAQMNRELRGDMETLFLAPEVEHSFLSASLVREVASLGGDVSRFVSPPVLERLQRATERRAAIDGENPLAQPGSARRGAGASGRPGAPDAQAGTERTHS